MSKMFTTELKCPHCKNIQKVEIWESINVTLDPELKAKLFDNKINLFNCGECKKEAFVEAPLLYHDMDRKFCVQYYPTEYLEHKDFYHQFTMDGEISMSDMPEVFADAVTYMSKPHIVFDMNEMIRYVMFRDRLAGLANT